MKEWGYKMKNLEKTIKKYETITKKLYDDGYMDLYRKETLFHQLWKIREYHKAIKEIRAKYSSQPNETDEEFVNVLKKEAIDYMGKGFVMLPFQEELNGEKSKIVIIPSDKEISKNTNNTINGVHKELEDVIIHHYHSKILGLKGITRRDPNYYDLMIMLSQPRENKRKQIQEYTSHFNLDESQIEINELDVDTMMNVVLKKPGIDVVIDKILNRPYIEDTLNKILSVPLHEGREIMIKLGAYILSDLIDEDLDKKPKIKSKQKGKNKGLLKKD